MAVNALLDLRGGTALITSGAHGLGPPVAEILGKTGARWGISSRNAEEFGGRGRTSRRPFPPRRWSVKP